MSVPDKITASPPTSPSKKMVLPKQRLKPSADAHVVRVLNFDEPKPLKSEAQNVALEAIKKDKTPPNAYDQNRTDHYCLFGATRQGEYLLKNAKEIPDSVKSNAEYRTLRNTKTTMKKALKVKNDIDANKNFRDNFFRKYISDASYRSYPTVSGFKDYVLSQARKHGENPTASLNIFNADTISYAQMLKNKEEARSILYDGNSVWSNFRSKTLSFKPPLNDLRFIELAFAFHNQFPAQYNPDSVEAKAFWNIWKGNINFRGDLSAMFNKSWNESDSKELSKENYERARALINSTQNLEQLERAIFDSDRIDSMHLDPELKAIVNTRKITLKDALKTFEESASYKNFWKSIHNNTSLPLVDFIYIVSSFNRTFGDPIEYQISDPRTDEFWKEMVRLYPELGSNYIVEFNSRLIAEIRKGHCGFQDQQIVDNANHAAQEYKAVEKRAFESLNAQLCAINPNYKSLFDSFIDLSIKQTYDHEKLISKEFKRHSVARFKIIVDSHSEFEGLLQHFINSAKTNGMLSDPEVEKMKSIFINMIEWTTSADKNTHQDYRKFQGVHDVIYKDKPCKDTKDTQGAATALSNLVGKPSFFNEPQQDAHALPFPGVFSWDLQVVKDKLIADFNLNPDQVLSLNELYGENDNQNTFFKNLKSNLSYDANDNVVLELNNITLGLLRTVFSQAQMAELPPGNGFITVQNLISIATKNNTPEQKFKCVQLSLMMTMFSMLYKASETECTYPYSNQYLDAFSEKFLVESDEKGYKKMIAKGLIASLKDPRPASREKTYQHQNPYISSVSAYYNVILNSTPKTESELNESTLLKLITWNSLLGAKMALVDPLALQRAKKDRPLKVIKSNSSQAQPVAP